MVGSALFLDALHEAFHFSDWLAWGAGIPVLWPFSPEFRDLIYPLYGARNMAGYVSHAITGSVRLLALALAFIYLWRHRLPREAP